MFYLQDSFEKLLKNLKRIEKILMIYIRFFFKNKFEDFQKKIKRLIKKICHGMKLFKESNIQEVLNLLENTIDHKQQKQKSLQLKRFKRYL